MLQAQEGYFVHNKVESIEAIADAVRSLPDTSNIDDLMRTLVARNYDSTTSLAAE